MLELNKIYQGDCLEVMKSIDDNFIDAIITDPPYGLEFMGKEWDKLWTKRDPRKDSSIGRKNDPYIGAQVDKYVGGVEAQKWHYNWAVECLRVLKPGGYLLSFGGTRTYHRMACAIEDAGFEIRDMIEWIYGQGFPKSSRVNLNPKFCQCVVSGHNGENTSPSQLQVDHRGRGLVSHDDDLHQVNVDHLKNKSLNSLDDCQQPDGLCDEHAHPDLKNDQAFVPQQEYVQEHNHSFLNGDDQFYESLHNPSVVQYNDHPSSQDYSDHDLIGNAKQESISLSNKLSDISLSSVGKPDNSLNLSYTNNSTGFPICQVCGKPKADGIGTALKPAHEPICMARKPLSEKTVAENILKYGTGGINIDECRIEGIPPSVPQPQFNSPTGKIYGFKAGEGRNGEMSQASGRFPANLIHDGSDVVMAEFEKYGVSKSPKTYIRSTNVIDSNINWNPKKLGTEQIGIGDSGTPARFFYCAKASKSERDMGCEGLEEKQIDGTGGNEYMGMTSAGNRKLTTKNNHPTVKPIKLMEYLIKLVTTENAIVLDPFAGSGSTLIACRNLGRNYIGIEKEADYIEIANKRIVEIKQQLTLI